LTCSDALLIGYKVACQFESHPLQHAVTQLAARARTTPMEAKGVYQDSIDRYWFVHVPADRPPWTDTGIEVVAGDRLSVFCAGRAWIKKHPQAWVEAYFALWLRIGERAEMFRTPKGSLTFTAGHSGRLYLSNVFPGQWVDAYGRMANAAVLEAYRRH
jgi:hypothetical protein